MHSKRRFTRRRDEAYFSLAFSLFLPLHGGEQERNELVVSKISIFFPLCPPSCAWNLFIMLHKHCSKHSKSRRAVIKVFIVAFARSKCVKSKSWISKVPVGTKQCHRIFSRMDDKVKSWRYEKKNNNMWNIYTIHLEEQRRYGV